MRSPSFAKAQGGNRISDCCRLFAHTPHQINSRASSRWRKDTERPLLTVADPNNQQGYPGQQSKDKNEW
jgi:hypothetical protein